MIETKQVKTAGFSRISRRDASNINLFDGTYGIQDKREERNSYGFNNFGLCFKGSNDTSNTTTFEFKCVAELTPEEKKVYQENYSGFIMLKLKIETFSFEDKNNTGMPDALKVFYKGKPIDYIVMYSLQSYVERDEFVIGVELSTENYTWEFLEELQSQLQTPEGLTFEALKEVSEVNVVAFLHNILMAKYQSAKAYFPVYPYNDLELMLNLFGNNPRYWKTKRSITIATENEERYSRPGNLYDCDFKVDKRIGIPTLGDWNAAVGSHKPKPPLEFGITTLDVSGDRIYLKGSENGKEEFNSCYIPYNQFMGYSDENIKGIRFIALEAYRSFQIAPISSLKIDGIREGYIDMSDRVSKIVNTTKDVWFEDMERSLSGKYSAIGFIPKFSSTEVDQDYNKFENIKLTYIGEKSCVRYDYRNTKINTLQPLYLAVGEFTWETSFVPIDYEAYVEESADPLNIKKNG